MFQTETLLLFLLGFSLSALIFLFVGRLLWSWALRIGARRMQRQVPSTLAELHAERDRLRAEYARLSQKLGAQLENSKTLMAEQQAEVARNRNRMDNLVIDLNARDASIVSHEQTILELQGKVSAMEVELSENSGAINALHEELRQKEAQIADMKTSLASFAPEPLLDGPQIEPQIVPPPVRTPVRPDQTGAQERLKHRIEKLTAMSQQIAETRSTELLPSTPPTEKLTQVARQTEEIEKELSRLDEAWNAKLNATTPQGAPQPQAEPRQPRAVANVISLANRLRSLQKDASR